MIVHSTTAQKAREWVREAGCLHRYREIIDRDEKETSRPKNAMASGREIRRRNFPQNFTRESGFRHYDVMRYPLNHFSKSMPF